MPIPRRAAARLRLVHTPAFLVLIASLSGACSGPPNPSPSATPTPSAHPSPVATPSPSPTPAPT
ncbi:MAG TPA: hypothetical protein VK600_04680, partial [Candidatus Saccharimonadales bacterium]|nr:hypothetical protein [Candidatus Saccharimonadales bacterium]